MADFPFDDKTLQKLLKEATSLGNSVIKFSSGYIDTFLGVAVGAVLRAESILRKQQEAEERGAVKSDTVKSNTDEQQDSDLNSD